MAQPRVRSDAVWHVFYFFLMIYLICDLSFCYDGGDADESDVNVSVSFSVHLSLV